MWPRGVLLKIYSRLVKRFYILQTKVARVEKSVELRVVDDEKSESSIRGATKHKKPYS